MLAPMAGVTDLPFRLIAREFGCPLAFTEMINSRALGLRNGKTLGLLRSSPLDKPLGVQLLGREPDALIEGLDALADYPYDVVDLNAACPVHKVTRKGEGAALLREPETLFRLVSALVKHAPVPVTVKIRSGWDDHSINAPETAKRIEAAGAAAICVHGRTRNQGYRGKADTSVIRAVKKAVGIPVIASGDVFSQGAAAQIKEETGCDAVMIARGALGNPWIFRDLALAHGKGGRDAAWCGLPAASMRGGAPTTVAEVKSIMEKHLALSVDYHGPLTGVINFRKCFVWYTRGLKDARVLRVRAVHALTVDEMRGLIDELQTPLSHGSSPPASQASPYGLHQGLPQAETPGSPC
jgi:tRNA-dihydrouridine synthase B